MFSMNLCQNRKHQDLILPAVKLLLFLKSEVASPRSEATSVASSEVASEIDRSATSEVAEARPTDR